MAQWRNQEIEGPDGGVLFRSQFNRNLALVVWAVCGLGAASALWAFGLTELGYVLPVGLLCFATWAAFWRPHLVVDPKAVTIRNVTHEVRIPWAALIQVETKYALTLLTPGRRFSVWVAPSPGQQSTRYQNLRRRGHEKRAGAAEPLIPLGESARADSGRAAALVRDRWNALIATDTLEVGQADSHVVRRVWDVPILAATGVLLVASMWSLS